jgi:16S rRNA (uracil1498-N3)-methyltransferase
VSKSTFLVEPEICLNAEIGSTFIVDSATAHHIRVARVKDSEFIDIVDGQGNRYTGQMTGVDTFHVHELVHDSPPPILVTVAQGLIKGDRLERAIEMMTEVGAVAFIPWQADHSVVMWNKEKAERNMHKWLNVVRAATEQSRRSFVPSIEPLVTGTQLADLGANFDHVVIMEESGGLPEVSKMVGKVLLVIGPEGGLSDSERHAFAALDNASSLTLGSSVLRSGTAGVVGLTYLFTRS